ncbi:MAG: ethylbenzene dehydrogenase-related protein [Candidatus Hydrothermarchaeaceae archaeon]
MRTTVVMFMTFAFLGLMALGAPVLAEGNELKARKVDKGPVIDGKPDKIWNKVRPIKMKLVEGDKGFNVTASAKAMYTDTDVYFLIRWKDPTYSQNRVYEFDGTQWEKRKGNEDRLGMLWDINGNIKDFKTKGCAILCHEEGKYMKTNAPSERADIWHWKAQRSNPVGYADDQMLTDIKKKKGHEETGRVADKKEGGSYSSNWDEEAKWPKNMFKDMAKSGPVLLKAHMVKITKASTFAKGAILPREVLSRPVGSRGDIEAKGIWKKGAWTLEIKRALNTGHDDDVQFDPSKVYYFGMSIFDNGDGKEHAIAKETAYTLIFK